MNEFSVRIDKDAEVPMASVWCKGKEETCCLGTIPLVDTEGKSVFASSQEVMDVGMRIVEAWLEAKKSKEEERRKNLESMPKEILEMSEVVLKVESTNEDVAEVINAEVSP